MCVQVLDQRLLIESMALDIAVLHARSALLHRAVSGWRREAANAATARDHAERHAAMWSKVSTWLKKPEDGQDIPDGAACISSKGNSAAEARFSYGALPPSNAKERDSGSGMQNEVGGVRHAAHKATGNEVLGLAHTFANQLDKILDTPPRLDVQKLIEDAAQPHPHWEAACPAYAPFKGQISHTVETLLQPAFLSSSCSASNKPDLASTDRSGQHSGTLTSCLQESTAGVEDSQNVSVVEGRAESKQALGRGRRAVSSSSQQAGIHQAIHEKLAKFVKNPQSVKHQCVKQPGLALAVAHEECTVDASSVEATPLKPTLKTGRHAKVTNIPKWAIREHSTSSEQAAGDNDGASLGIVAAHQALTAGQEAGVGGESEEDSDDEFAWIMHRQLPRF